MISISQYLHKNKYNNEIKSLQVTENKANTI